MYDPSSPMLRPGLSEGGLPSPDAKSRFAEDRLLDAVIWCDIRPGETVTEADVMDRYGLTRAAARAGLTRLGFDGWATPRARLGWQILPVNGQLIGHVLSARRTAEPALGAARLTIATRRELEQIAAILAALSHADETAATPSIRHYVDRIDGLLLGTINPFTARHLRKLWHHSARITHFLEDESGMLFRRDEITALLTAVLAEDGDGIVEARGTLIDAQERYFLARLLDNDAPLASGKGLATRPPRTPAATHWRNA